MDADTVEGGGVHQPNDRLRQAREATPSTRTPGDCLSRQEVAERVNEWLFHHDGIVVELDANYIGKLERGIIRWPGRQYRAAFRAVLGADTDIQLGFYGRRRRRRRENDMDRQQFLRGAITAMALPWLDSLAPQRAQVPSRIGVTEIEHIRSTAVALTQQDNTRGGGLVREVALTSLRSSAHLLQADCPASLRPELFSAVAYLGAVAGYIAYDVAHGDDDARRAFQFSLRCAEEADDWQLRTFILTRMSRQATRNGVPEDGLTFAELALVRQDRLTAVERAHAHTQQALALAKLGRAQETLAAVGAADDGFSNVQIDENPPWMSFYDDAQHHTSTGEALLQLAIGGHPTQSAPRLAYAIAHHDGHSRARARTVSQVRLATFLMATGDPREAAVVGHGAVAEASRLRSHRLVQDIQELDRHASRHPTVVEAVELRTQIHDQLTHV